MNPETEGNEQEEHDFLNEFRQRVASNSFSDIEEKEKLRHKKNKGIFIGVLGGVVLAGLIGWFLVSPKFGGYDETQVPVVRRDESPIKVKPSDPGGLDIPNRDKSVYGMIEEGNDNAVVEKLLPAEERPIKPEPADVLEDEIAKLATKIDAEQEMIKKDMVKAAPVEAVKKESVAPVKTVTETVVAQTVTTTTPVVKEVAKPAPVVAPVKVTEPVKAPIVKEVAKPAPTKTVAKPAPAKTVAKPAPIAKAVTTTTTKGNWQVQIVSGKNKKAVETTKDKLYKKHNTILSGVTSEIVKADLGAKGIYYRLMLGAYGNKANAISLCTKLKAAKENCFVKQKK